MAQRPQAVLFDVNQTLFSLEALRTRMQGAGLTQPQDLEVWFAQVLRDGMAATAAGSFVPFKEVGAFHLRRMLAAAGVSAQQSQETAQHILGAFTEAPPFADVGPALRVLHDAGIQVAAMTNGTAEIANSLLEKAGVKQLVAAVLDVEAPGAWKPAAAAYDHAVMQLRLQPDEVMLAAVHPWDTNGAQAAGLRAAFIARNGEPFPPFYTAPHITVSSLSELADVLAKWPA